MKGMFVNSDGCVPYAEAIVSGAKVIETRSRDTLWRLDGERVAVIRTRRGKAPTIIGYVTINGRMWCEARNFGAWRNGHLIPEGSKYDAGNRGKWLYFLDDPEECKPYPLPADAVRHGRSWAEFAICR